MKEDTLARFDEAGKGRPALRDHAVSGYPCRHIYLKTR
jgi:hypothetical protein